MKQLETLARCACIFLIVLSGCTRSYSFQGRVVNGDGVPIEGATFEVHDLITGETYKWSTDNYVRLDAFHEPAHIFKIGKVL